MKLTRCLSSTLATTLLVGCAVAPRPDDPVPGEAKRSARAATPAAAAQDTQTPDYSPTGMFYETHGDFRAKSDRYRPSFTASARVLPDAAIRGETGDFDLYHFKVAGDAEIVVDPDSVVIVGGLAEAKRYDYSTDFGGVPPVEDETVWGLGLDLGYGRFMTDDTYLDVTFKPGVYSDLDGTLKSDDWKFYVTGLATFRYSEDLYLKGGIEYSGVFESVPVYPLAGLSWIFHPNWRFDMLLPRRIEMSYLASTASTLYVGMDLDGQEYHVRSSLATGKREFDLTTQELQIYVGGVHRFNDFISAFARVGAAVAGDNQTQTESGVRVAGQLEPTFMLELGLGWDF